MTSSSSSSSPVTIITGGTAGIGLAAARALVERGHRVLITGRDQTRLERLRDELKVEIARLDLERFSSVRSFADDVRARFPTVRALIHNAGAVYPDRRITEDGNEAQLQIIHLAPFLLTALLRKHLVESAHEGQRARVVNVVSVLHKNASHVDDWNADTSWPRMIPMLGSVRSYARAELFKTCATFVWARKLQGLVDVNCVHPGGIRTQLFRQFRPPLSWLLWLSDLLKRGPAFGSRGLVHLADADLGSNPTGGYYVGKRVATASKRAHDVDVQAEVWRETTRRVGLDLTDPSLN